MFSVIQMVFPTNHPICGGYTNPFDIAVKNTGWLAAGDNCWLPHLPLLQHTAALDIFLELSLTILILFLCLLFCLPVLLPVPHISQWMHIILRRWWQHCLEPSSLNADCRNFAHSCKMSSLGCLMMGRQELDVPWTIYTSRKPTRLMSITGTRCPQNMGLLIYCTAYFL